MSIYYGNNSILNSNNRTATRNNENMCTADKNYHRLIISSNIKFYNISNVDEILRTTGPRVEQNVYRTGLLIVLILLAFR